MRIQVNEPHIVHETIDGETILMDLRSGNYFSIEKSGAVIWEVLAQTGNTEDLLKTASELCESNQVDQIISEIKIFIDKLVDEDLMVQADSVEISEIAGELLTNLERALTTFEAPLLNKYSDMQDMLLLDPIHDVDEKGWPEPKKDK